MIKVSAKRHILQQEILVRFVPADDHATSVLAQSGDDPIASP